MIVAWKKPSRRIPSASGCVPVISIDRTVGIRWRSQMSAETPFGSAVPSWLPTIEIAGPDPAITRRAVPPLPSIPVRPVRARSIVSVREMRYSPRGKTRSPSPSASACSIAVVSSVTPSPTAPKSRSCAMRTLPAEPD